MSVIVASPVRQDPATLALFLRSLQGLREQTPRFHRPEFRFYDDNTDPESSAMLRAFPHAKVVEASKAGDYQRSATTHHWNDAAIERVTAMKNDALRISADRVDGVSHLFLIDSDVLVPPDTIERLAAAEKDIISNVYWTSWQPGTVPMPQVWEQDLYSMGEGFLERLREPGVYEVGGLGACTLISREAIQQDVSFDRLHNVSFWGEDRHFCIRGVALGLSLWVDTRGPGMHLYRASDLEEGERWLARNCER